MNGLLLLLASLGISRVLTAIGTNEELPSIVPWPHSVTRFPGTTVLPKAAVVAAATPELLQLASELASEIHVLGRVPCSAANAQSGQVLLRLDRSHTGESFQVDTRGPIVISAGSYEALAMGTSELIQCLDSERPEPAFPRLLIEDRPLFSYRGLMLDVARKPHPIKDLQRAVMLCHLYRVRYLQLHLTDDQGWTFPSSRFPRLGSRNESYEGAGPPTRYVRSELESLVRFADRLGVTLVPEIDTPGHSAAMRRAMPARFASPAMGGDSPGGMIDILESQAVDSVKTILAEEAALFRSSPYLHVGADEAEIGNLQRNPRYKAALARGGFLSPWDLFLNYVNELGSTVRSMGRTPIVWEFCRNHPGHNVKLPEGSTIMAWEDASGGARDMLDNGYSVINVPWTIGYRADPRNHFLSDPYNVNGTLVHPGEALLGLQLNVWESTPDQEWPDLRASLPARMETAWQYPVQGSYEQFNRRLKSADLVFARLAGLPEENVRSFPEKH
jgi:hexosaminidase